MKSILIINAYQIYEGIGEGKLNKTIAKTIQSEFEQNGNEVKITNIEKGCDIQEEIEKHKWADLIIVQSPVYWFGSPWIYKKYIDEVFTTAMMQGDLLENDGRSSKNPSKQYGTGGKMQGKKFMLSLTWNAPKEAFGDEQQTLMKGKTIDDAFVSQTLVYKFCGAEILPAFACYDVIKNPKIEEDITRLKTELKKIIGQRF